MGINIAKTTNQLSGGAGSDYGSMGVGLNESSYREVTRKGAFPSDNTGPGRSQGEVPGAGTIYSAMLNERPNLSNPRNRGPERAPSRIGANPIPVVTAGQRNTGRIRG